MRVLLVEDNRDTLATLSAVLRFEKYEVVTALDGPTAIEIAKLYPPDAVLLDIGLPGLDGYKVAKALRELRPGNKLLIAAITGYGTAEDKRRALEAGIDAHLTKPADVPLVLQVLKNFQAMG